MSHLKRVTLALGAILLMSTPAYAADITFDVPETRIASFVQDAVTSFVREHGAEYSFAGVTLADAQSISVSTGKASETAVQLTITLQFVLFAAGLPVSFDAPIYADLSLDCDSGGPSLRFDGARVGDGLPVTEEDLASLESAANGMVADKTDAIFDAVWRSLGNMKGLASARQVCPHIEVSEAGALHGELDFTNGCINGKEKVTACATPKFWGKGSTFRCSNGTWHLVKKDCEIAF